MNRTIVWEWVDKAGLEVLFLKEEPFLITASGIIAGELNGTAFKLHYKVECDNAWNYYNSDLILESNKEKKNLSLKRKNDNKWFVNNQSRNDLEGCSYIDIMTSPFTNTLPIRNLKLKTNQSIVIKVAYIKVTDMQVFSVEQEYTRLDKSEPPSRFLYRNLSNDFKAEIEVDKDGIVIDYPNIWKRISLID